MSTWDFFQNANKHLTGAPSSYTPLLVLGPAPHDPTIHKTRMTRVVNGVRHTTLSDAMFGRNCQCFTLSFLDYEAIP